MLNYIESFLLLKYTFIINNLSNMTEKKLYTVEEAEKLSNSEVVELYKKYRDDELSDLPNFKNYRVRIPDKGIICCQTSM